MDENTVFLPGPLFGWGHIGCTAKVEYRPTL